MKDQQDHKRERSISAALKSDASSVKVVTSEREDSEQVSKPIPRPATLYLDESGSRHPDKKTDPGRQGRDWFGLGGILIRGEDSDPVRVAVASFSENWRLKSPLHFTDMQSENKGFAWLGRANQKEKERFWSEWRDVLCSINVIGMGCVIDRPGYVKRGYLDKHNDRWLLCRSAFDIVVERAAKIAKLEGRKLHVVFEQDAGINKTVTGYFDNLKTNGLAFDAGTSSRYVPLSRDDFATTLGRIQHKPKAYNLLQIADSYIYAMCRHGYQESSGFIKVCKKPESFLTVTKFLPKLGQSV